MDIAISNLAFDRIDLTKVLKIFNKYRIKKIEGVLSKIEDFIKLSYNDVFLYSEEVKRYGVTISSFQSLFFQSGINSFDDNLCFSHLKKVIDFCSIANSKILVLGSPTLRTKNSKSNLMKILRTIDSYLYRKEMILCIEPNSKIFNGDYFHNLEEISFFIKHGKFKRIKTMIDTFNLLSEGFDPILEFEKYERIIKHVHISEENLKPIENNEFHINFSKFLKKKEIIVTYEIKKPDDFEETIHNFCQIYRG